MSDSHKKLDFEKSIFKKFFFIVNGSRVDQLSAQRCVARAGTSTGQAMARPNLSRVDKNAAGHRWLQSVKRRDGERESRKEGKNRELA